MSDPRQPHLEALGLTLWQRRAEPVSTEPEADALQPGGAESTIPGEPEPAPAEAPPPVSEPPENDPGQPAADIAALDWDTLAEHLAAQDHRGASQPVFGVGARDADLLIIGEAPGADEDRRGEPFVGRAGKLLDRMLFAMGRDRATNTYIANICKFRPPNNRDPRAEEVATDRPYLERQIDLLAPKLIIAVGRVAAQNLLQTDSALGRMRGRLHAYPGRDIPVLVTYHPAYLLRTPQHKARAWADLKTALARLDGRQ